MLPKNEYVLLLKSGSAKNEACQLSNSRINLFKNIIYVFFILVLDILT